MKSRLKPVTNTRGYGVSLVELMIALSLGIVLLLGLIQVFGGVRASFNAADSRARIQENGRFALEFIRRDARMTGHFGCRNEFHHFPTTVNRPTEFPGNGAQDVGFSNHLLPPFPAGTAADAFRENAPYVTQVHNPIEIYDFANTGIGDAAFVIASDNPAPAGTAASWGASFPNAGLGNIAARAIPGSDILVMRYFDENTIVVTGPVTPAGVIPLGADAANVQRFALYGMTNCKMASLFQVTAPISATSIAAAAGGLNVARNPAGQWFRSGAGENYSNGVIFHRYRFAVYYIGQGVNGPALFRQELQQVPASAAQGIQLSVPVEMVEGVEMMQILAGVDTESPREDFVNRYVDPDTLVTGAATIAARDNAFRSVSSLRISLLIRGNASSNATRTRNTIVVGDLNVTLPNDGRARQTYDATIAIRNRLRA